MDKKTLLLILVGLALRLGLIFPGPLESKVGALMNKADLRNYYWPAQAALRGENPYELWATGASGEFRADMAPLELLIYVVTVRVWNDPRAIQVLFALFDVANIGLLGLLLRESPLKRPFQLFYAVGPLTLYNLVLVPEDKTIVLTLTFLVFWLLLVPRETNWGIRTVRVSAVTLAVAVAAVLASFKWLSVFYLLPLLWFASQDVRGMIKFGALFGGIVLVLHVPWFPTWSYVYTFRLARVVTPIHIAPAVLLKALGLFDKTMLTALLAACLAILYWLFWKRRLDIFETIGLSTAAGILWTPDMDPVHLSLVVLGLLLVVDWVRGGRWFVVWVLSFWVAAVYAISTRTGWARYGLPDLQRLTGAYGSPQMILWSYTLFVVVFALYLIDKWRGRAVGRSILLGEGKDDAREQARVPAAT